MAESEWIYDWNLASPPLIPPGTRILLNDETLRDGLQNPSVHDPGIEEKIRILHLMESLGIDSVNIGLPGAGPRAVEHTEALAREIAANRMKIRPNAAARTHENDIRPIVEKDNEGKYVAIDIESGAYEMDEDEIAASDRLLARNPNAQIWLIQIGASTARHFGGRSLSASG